MKGAFEVLKRNQVITWIQKFRKSESKVMVSNYTYNCFFTGKCINKTLIVFPEELDKKGVIAINKPLHEVEIIDIIKLYNRI